MSTATTEEIRTLTDRWFQEVWNERRKERIYAWIAPHCKIHGLHDQIIFGPDPFVGFFDMMIAAMPDIKVEPVDHVVEGNKVCSVLKVRGTHLGPLAGIAATGQELELLAMTYAIWQDGQIVEAYNQIDLKSGFASV